MALYLRGIAPVGEGLTGRGMEHPPPLSRCVTEDVFPCEQSINPHRPAAPEGGQYGAIAPDSRAIGGERIFQECQVRPRRYCQIPRHCIHGESPPRGGADGEGVEDPPPLSPVSAVERCS